MADVVEFVEPVRLLGVLVLVYLLAVLFAPDGPTLEVTYGPEEEP